MTNAQKLANTIRDIDIERHKKYAPEMSLHEIHTLIDTYVARQTRLEYAEMILAAGYFNREMMMIDSKKIVEIMAKSVRGVIVPGSNLYGDLACARDEIVKVVP